MKFSTAWASVLAQNLTLKVSVAFLTFCTVALSIALIRISSRAPLIIERACFSRPLETASNERTDAEIESFVREAVRLRFDSDAPAASGVLSDAEEIYRKEEQELLKANKMTQKIIVNSLKHEKNVVTVDADRLIAVDAVRSAFPFPLTVTLASTPRSDGNPYGLAVVSVSALKKEEGGQK